MKMLWVGIPITEKQFQKIEKNRKGLEPVDFAMPALAGAETVVHGVSHKIRLHEIEVAEIKPSGYFPCMWRKR